jgi:hypothetical protein
MATNCELLQNPATYEDTAILYIVQQEMYVEERKYFVKVSKGYWDPNTTRRCSFISLSIKHIRWGLLQLAALFGAFTIYGTIRGIDAST